jgi:hypothetical protein
MELYPKLKGTSKRFIIAFELLKEAIRSGSVNLTNADAYVYICYAIADELIKMEEKK